jgi:prepilin-type N-terminal cleavage/methylation domain-containing protein
MNFICHTSNESGYSLIEVLAAIVIFSIGLMAVGLLQAQSLRGAGDLARKTEALNFLEQQAGQLKMMPFYTEVAPNLPVTPNPALAAGGFNAPNHFIDMPVDEPRFTVQWAVVDDVAIGQQNGGQFKGVPAGLYTVAKQITIAVTPLGGVAPNDNIVQAQFLKTWATTNFR